MGKNQNHKFLDLPWTIEQQLKAYAEAEGRTERHEILYWSWKQNRRWFAQILEYTVASFPSYSQHNETHCRAVIHNIECLLGEDEIRRLSPTDCFTILMAVYLHDVGMSMTDDDRRGIVNSKEFLEWVAQLENSTDLDYKEAVQSLQRTDYSQDESDDSTINYRRLYSQKLDVFYALTFLISSQQRKNHAAVAAERMKSWVLNPDKLEGGLSMTGIPTRIFLLVAECARLHGEMVIEDLMGLLMQLPESDNGFAQDMYHPRFNAVLILIGDALDIDNNRFHPFAEAYSGKLFNKSSQMHYRKHQAIRALQITSKKIYIRADCENPSEMRQLRSEIVWLQEFIKECSYQWSKIAPENYCGCLPVVEFERISLGGKAINEQLVKAQFKLSQEKAFRLLEGASLYGSAYVYLREMIQNAIDAVKHQYWIDLDATECITTADISLCEANQELPLRRYPVKIDFAVRKRLRESPEKLEPVTIEDLELTEEELEKYEFGVAVSVQDCGIGIGAEDICAISKVGTSQEHRRNMINRMPLWLHPTGRFGIGLQSLFQVDNLFWCITRTHQEECYEMIFHSGTNSEGYINVIPRDWHNGEYGSVPYGTKFTVFVSEHKKELHNKDMSGWAGMDPHDKDYDKSRMLRRSFELMKQMEHCLNGWIGECLFPMIVREEELHASLKSEWSKKLEPKQSNWKWKIQWQLVSAGAEKEVIARENENQHCWIFEKLFGNNESDLLCAILEDGSAYDLDVEEGKLYVWSQSAKCFFCCGPKRIIQATMKGGREKNIGWKNGRKESPDDNGDRIKLFLKGLFVTDITYKENELIEFIDIKNDSIQDYLYMNRDALSQEGENYVRNKIIPKLRQTFRLVLKAINQKAVLRIEENREWLKNQISTQYKTIFHEFGKTDCMQIDHLLKKLNSLDLFDYTLVEGDIDSAVKTVKNSRILSTVENHGCHKLLKCVEQIDFSALVEQENTDNDEKIKSSCIERMRVSLQTKIKERKEKIKKGIDLFSYLLNSFAAQMAYIDSLICSEQGKQTMQELEKCINKMQEYVVLYAMFFFYMNQEGMKQNLGCAAAGSPCGWEYVNTRIAKALRAAYMAYKNIPNISLKEPMGIYSSILFIPACEEDNCGQLSEIGYSFADIMCNEYRFAVFSNRFSEYDLWKHLLIRLSDVKTPDKVPWLNDQELVMEHEPAIRDAEQMNILNILKTEPKDEKTCRQRWAHLDRWNDQIIKDMILQWRTDRNLTNPNGDQRSYNRSVDELIWGNGMTRWIVHKLPVICLGSDESGNSRLNVLTCRAQPHVFFDFHMISLLLQRMQEYYAQYRILRFSTTVWDGLDALRCRDISSDIINVNRGIMPEANRKSRMLLAVNSELPLESMLPRKDELETESERLEIHTFYELLDELKQSYYNPEEYPLFAFYPAKKIIKECKRILEIIPFSSEYEDADWEVVHKLRKYCHNHPEYEIDRGLMVRNQGALHDMILSAYWSYYGDRTMIPKRIGWTQYNQVDIQVERQRYINSFLIETYGFDLDDLPEELADLPHYRNSDHIDGILRKVYLAFDYYYKASLLDYRNTFLAYACKWYHDEIWKKDSGTDTFLKYSQQVCEMSTPQELESLYMAQIRRIFCASMINITPLFFEERPYKDDIMRMQNQVWINSF